MGELNLSVEIDSQSGFCFGVIEAINKAEEALANNEELYCLGEIVHNDEEINRLQKKGLKFINYQQFKQLKNKKILFGQMNLQKLSYCSTKTILKLLMLPVL